tara:strand:- start:4672 stop:5031 length:360 start_codon:yes stop_codon:yes gene_type:complete
LTSSSATQSWFSIGDPEAQGKAEDAIACVRMALQMIQEVDAMDIQIRVGMNSCSAYAGNFGTQQQMNYTTIGNAVNAAARLEHASEPGQVLTSQATYELVKDDFWCEERGPMKVKGIER